MTLTLKSIVVISDSTLNGYSTGQPTVQKIVDMRIEDVSDS